MIMTNCIKHSPLDYCDSIILIADFFLLTHTPSVTETDGGGPDNLGLLTFLCAWSSSSCFLLLACNRCQPVPDGIKNKWQQINVRCFPGMCVFVSECIARSGGGGGGGGGRELTSQAHC